MNAFMKNLLLVLACIIGLSACKDEEVAPDTPEQLTLVKVTKTMELMQGAYLDLSAGIDPQFVVNTKKASANKSAFLTKMDEKSMELFQTFVKNNRGNMPRAGYMKLDDIKGETTKASLLRGLTIATGDPFSNYQNRIMPFMEQQSTASPLIVLSKPAVAESSNETFHLTLSNPTVGMVWKLSDVLVSSYQVDDSEVLKEVDDILSGKNESPVLIALLLPAVQAAREAARRTNAEPLTPNYATWVGGITPKVQGSLDRDIIRRIVRRAETAGMLASLEMISTDEYDGTDPETAALMMAYARYRATTMMIWSDLWDQK